MNCQSAQAVAILAGIVAAALAGVLAYDGTLFALRGNEATISHGMWMLGQSAPWVRWAWLGFWAALAVGLAWHFGWLS